MAPRAGGGAHLTFDALSIKGGLLGADWLGKIAQLGASAQTPDDYRILKGLDLRDEIARSWRIAQACFQEMQMGRTAGGETRALAARFVENVLRDAFGFESIARVDPAVIRDRIYPAQLSALDDRVPIVVAPIGAGLETRLPELGDGHRPRSAFELLQEYLNALDPALWGLVSDGLTLRLVRNNASLTRPAWIEADLARIFTEALYSDFAALWLLVHESRFSRGTEDDPATCPLEAWRKAGLEAGVQARERLSKGFKKALEKLGQGFLSHAENVGLRAALHSGRLTKDSYFGQLLRVVYRVIFLLAIEERNLLHPKNTPAAARDLYAGGYALHRLRDRAIRRSAHDRQSDLWEAVKVVVRGLVNGEPRLGLPALAGLFGDDQCPELDMAKVENHALLSALFDLAWLRESSGLVHVNWRDMGSDELGYVYEGLLELQPQITQDGRSFSFAEADESESRGHARKLSGSYYTPDELVQLLLNSALEPVIQRTLAAHPDDSVDALLKLAIVDPACGSGHFLLAAGRRLAAQIARIRANGAPTSDDYQHALRDVVRRCIYGVDMNPLAVELCKVSLWMESIDPGLPLTFLESHIRHGNALLGATRTSMQHGVPDEAWVALEGDDKKIAAALKKSNKIERGGQKKLGFGQRTGGGDLRDELYALEVAADADVTALSTKRRRWDAFLHSPVYEHQKLVADAWCAAFLWPKHASGPVIEAAPTNATWQMLRDSEDAPARELIETTQQIAKDHVLFHWELAFPHVFSRGGFDVVLGNPPWEHIELKEQEFFAKREPAIADARNAAARKQQILALPTTNPALWAEWQLAQRKAQGEMHFARNCGRFSLSARGRINTYPLFAEHNWAILGPSGRAGFIVPSGIATDDTTKEYFQALVNRSSLASIYHFENEGLVFKGLHHAYRFVLLTIGEATRADLVFYAKYPSDLAEEERHFALSADDFSLLNPNTRTCPTFRSRRDAEINLGIYRRTSVLWREDDPHGNPWGLRFMQGVFNMASDSGLFRTHAELVSAGWMLRGNRFIKNEEVMLPLYEAKMVHHFDHRFGTYEGQTEAQANQGKLPELDDSHHRDPARVTLPKYWVSEAETESRLYTTWDKQWLLVWRDITGTEKIRTVIPCILPRVAVGHTAPLMFATTDASLISCLYANLCSLSLDYTARQKVGGLHLTYGYLKQLPLYGPADYLRPCSWDSAISIRDWLAPRVLELTYTAWDLKSFAEECGDAGLPFAWQPERRFQLQCEIDAVFFHLYGISRSDAGYILDTFPVLADDEQGRYGEYRTKRTILEIYDSLAKAVLSGKAYTSVLGPPTRVT